MKSQKLNEQPQTIEQQNIFPKAWNWYKERRRRIKEKRKQPQTLQQKLWSWTKTIVGAIIVVMFINGLLIASFVVPTGSMESTVMTGDFLFVNKFVYGPSTPQVVPFLNIPLPFFKFPGIKDPERGDVIVFIFPGEWFEVKAREFQYFLKRCVAIAGDSLQIIDNKIYVNGVEQPFPENGHVKMPAPDTLRPTSYPPGRTDVDGKPYFTHKYGPIRIPKEGDTIWLTHKNFDEWNIFIQREGHKVSKDYQAIYIDQQPVTYYIVERNYCFGIGDNRDNSHDSRFWGFIPYENVVGSPLMVYWSWNTDLPLFKIFDKIASVRWGRIFTFID